MIKTLRVVCLTPPAGNFGLQDKQKNLKSGSLQADASLVFECEVQVRKEGSKPVFSGDFIHGTAKERFLYLTLLENGEIKHRLKIQLGKLTWEQVENASVLEATISGIGAGTIPLLGEGWQGRGV